ncbi:MAG: hypothetical protein L3V56_02660 [Candidatus Magnetoovum sp. WYHC-5]|nr:hypothetical protein [Candidatus Magnetoovum sp. WYHC-5]
MGNSCNIGIGRVIVIYDSYISKKTHNELFGYADDVYVNGENRLMQAILEYKHLAEPLILHISAQWESMLALYLQTKRVTLHDTIAFLNVPCDGINSIEAVFWDIYYRKNFEVLKMVCRKVSDRVSGVLNNDAIKIQCHMVAATVKRIVASNL